MEKIEESVFAKIVRGEIPCYKVYEDEKCVAFLDIAPEAVGHTLVVPKMAVGKIYELPEEEFGVVMGAVRKLMRHYEKVLGKRMTMKVVGVDVPYAHVHILPLDEYLEESLRAETERKETKDAKKPQLSEEEMLGLKEKLKLG